MLQWEHSAILLTFIKLPFVIKIFVLSIFEWLLKTGFAVQRYIFVIKTQFSYYSTKAYVVGSSTYSKELSH